MFANKERWNDLLGLERPSGGLDADLLLPAAADVQEFLRKALGKTGAEWLAPVMPFCSNIPALSGNILEVHFDKAGNNVDFATRLNTAFDKPLLAGLGQQDYALPFMPDGFASLIQQNGNAFRHGVENIWVEYDAPFNGAPALFFDINRSKPYRPEEVFDNLQQITTALDYQIHGPIPEFLERINQYGLKVVYCGLMFSRKLPLLRLTINGIGAENLSEALRGLGWKGNYKALARLKSLYLSKEHKLVVGVDVGSDLEARIGIEVFENDGDAFVQQLHHNGHINSSHFEALRAWEQKFPLPGYLEEALTEWHRRPVTELHTRINHFKFVVDDTETIKAKGYLYYCF